jgi:phosphate transport system substrate-binding protein
MQHGSSIVAATARSLAILAALGIAVTMGGATVRAGDLKGAVKIDGSSTVAPISMGVAEQFQAEHKGVRVTVGVSGTGGGFKKFLEQQPQLRTDINNASRPITASEKEKAASLGVEYVEFAVAIDGLAVVAHSSNTFAAHLTLDELKRIWEPGSKINNWNQIRPEFPDLALKLYGPGTDSGTFDYFTEVVVGKEKSSRGDFTMSENDNVLVQGVAGDKGGLGYFGYSYYEANKSKLALLAVAGADGKPVKPSLETVRGHTYALARPLFIYVNKAAMSRPEVRGFLEFYFDHATEIVEHPMVNYVALDPAKYSENKAKLTK